MCKRLTHGKGALKTMAKDRKNQKTPTAPSEGERRAMTGFLPQYELAAWSIMHHLRERTLESIRLGDAEAGRVDDFVILSTNSVDGHSVKWSQNRDTITFKDFTKSRDKAPCLIAQLADGWKKLGSQFPTRRVTVHLVTCDIPSKSDECPGPEKESFASYYHEAWIPFQSDGKAIPDKWKVAWDAWQIASGLAADEFAQFARACNLDFHARTAADRTFNSRDELVLGSQLKQLAAELQNLVRDPSRQVEFTRDELLKRVGWSHLTEFRHQHEFPTRDPYEPIDSTVQELAHHLKALKGGYLALLGSPGSGKSTLLTRTLEAGLSDHRLVKYYAFVPGSADPRTRGESENFLHDLVLSLERAGFSVGESQSTFDRELLLGRLNEQLRMLGADFKESGFPTVILVDGLDHIPREQNPQRSLIGDLPLPDQIPEGVYLVLGSQTVELPGLPPAVRVSVQEPERHIQIAQMTRETVLKVLGATKLPFTPTAAQQDHIVGLAGGHPLALSLVLNRLRAVTSGDQMSAALADTVAYTGDLEAYYFAYWLQVEAIAYLADMLGLLARLRRPIDVDWVASWQPSPPLADLRRRFGHLFREARPGHLEFFHNSFRQFVLRKTAALKGGTPQAGDRDYHMSLAQLCEASSEPHSWEVVFHLDAAGESTRVLELATPDYFRRQLDSLRPLESIARDARYAAAAAGELEDHARLIRSGFFLFELSQRAYALDSWTVGSSLLSLGYLDLALEYLWEGNELKVVQAEAMRVARRLFVCGDTLLARRVFEAGEPLTLMQPAGEGESDFDPGRSDLLKAWAEAVPLFRPIDEVSKLIQGFVPPKARFGEAEDADESRRNLFYWAAESMERLGRMAEASALEMCLNKLEGETPDWSVWLTVHRFRRHLIRGRLADGETVLNVLLNAPTFASFPDYAKLLIAEGAQKLFPQQDTTAAILKAITPPSIALGHHVGDSGGTEALAVFRFYRLLMLTGDDVAPSTAVPDAAREDDWPCVLLGRTLVQLAKVSADAARGKVYSGADVRRELYLPLRLFNRSTKELTRWNDWYRVTQVRGEVDQLIVAVVKEHGMVALGELSAELERLWVDKDNRRTWPPEATRNVVMGLYDAGIPEEWTRSQLAAIADTMLEGEDVGGSIGECEKQVKAWSVLRDKAAAFAELQKLVSVSFGVGYRKDYQMDEWVEWLDMVLPLAPASVGERVALFAASIAGTEETTEGRGTRSAAIALIKSCVSVSPRRAVGLIRWFEKHGCINHSEAVAGYLLTAARGRLCRPSVLKAVYVNLLLSFANQDHAPLVQELLKYCSEGASRDVRISVCVSLVKATSIRSLPTSRPAILAGLAETAQSLDLPLRECGLEGVAPNPKQGGKYRSTLALLDGTSLDEEQAAARASSVDGFLGLARDSGGSYFPWNTLLEKLLPKLSRTDAIRLAHGLPPEFTQSLALSALSCRLSELGERGMAWDVAERALQASSTHGWAKIYDGGTRIEAIKALVLADAVPGRARALKEVAANLSSESGNSSALTMRLREIIPLLGPDLRPAKFYPLVEDYVRLLSAPLQLLDEATADLATTPNDDTCERGLCELLAFHMVDLIPVLAQGAKNAMAEILSSGSPAAERTVMGMLAGTEFQQVAAVELLEVLATKSHDAVRPFGQPLQQLALARNFWISHTATRLCIALNMKNTPSRPFEKLPAIYLIALPPSEDKAPTIGADEPFPDTENPRDMVRPYDYQLGILAKMARLDEESILVAASREMTQIAAASDFSAQSESAYRLLLAGAGLKLPFRRKRGAVAREAMRRVASDLIDAGRIHPRDVSTLIELVTTQDPDLATIDPIARPTAIKPLDGLNQYGSNALEWAESVSPSFRGHLRELGERLVLGEATRLKLLASSVPTETRTSVVDARSLRALDEEHPFERVFDVTKNSYARSALLEMEPSLPVVVRNQWLGSDTDGTDWIALNPLIAYEIGWKLAADGLFRWVDDIGEVMVETVWWKDGRVELGSGEPDAEVGEGFLVEATPTAAEAIFKFVQEPTRFMLLQRTCRSDAYATPRQSIQFCEPVGAQPK
jgi:hypothetical protein